uniref:GYD domain-containing protein n=1 Tax=candidate division WOR-3 bacterium TaxID=2052148 RepID=A0A7C3Z3J8_UNCW3
MPYYLLLTRLTDEGRKTLKENPGRLREVNREVEAMGAKIIAQYALLGVYDFLNLVEAPSNEIISKISVELGSRGTLEITTFPAIPIDEFLKSI